MAQTTWAAFPVRIIGRSDRSPRYTVVQYTGEPSVNHGTDNSHRAGVLAHVRTDALEAENATPITRYAEATAGTLTLRVTFAEWSLSDGEIRPQYRYRIADNETGQTHRGRDLYGPAVQVINPPHELSALVSFLSAAAEAYASTMAPYGPDDDAPWFPAWLQERAYINSDDLATLGDDLDTCPRCGGNHDRIDSREPCPTA